MTLAGANTLPDTPEVRDYNRQRRWLELGDLAVRWDPLESTCRHASLSIL